MSRHSLASVSASERFEELLCDRRHRERPVSLWVEWFAIRESNAVMYCTSEPELQERSVRGWGVQVGTGRAGALQWRAGWARGRVAHATRGVRWRAPAARTPRPRSSCQQPSRSYALCVVVDSRYSFSLIIRSALHRILGTWRWVLSSSGQTQWLRTNSARRSDCGDARLKHSLSCARTQAYEYIIRTNMI